MFKLHKHRPGKLGDKFEFRISHLKALQVPKGWDKLFVSVVSVENGKTIVKTSKVAVRNGSCRWSDTLSESIWVSRDKSSKETDYCLFKLIVAMGSLRSSILGEATVSMTSYVNSDAAVPLSIPLNKCNHGTVLNVTMQCLIPRTKPRDQESSKRNSHLKAMNKNNHEVADKSNGSDCSYVQSVISSSVDDTDSTLSPGEVETMATTVSGSISNYSYNSAEDSTGRGNFSQKSVSHYDYPVNNTSQSNRSSFSSQNMQEIGASCFKMTHGSNNSPEATEDTIEELRAEAKMWEINARKLLGDLEMLKIEFSNQSKKSTGLKKDLSTTYVERDSLKKEIEQLTLSSGEPIVTQKTLEDLLTQDELMFQKESNANLSSQLKKSQEANVKLVSVLQELEETIEQQKIDTESLSSLPSKLSTLEKNFQVSEEENRIFMQQIEQLEETNGQLSMWTSVLEKQVSDLTNEQESQLSELESARNQAARLQEKIMEIQSEMDSSIEDLKQKLNATQFQWSEAQEECEYFREENQQLQITNENLEEERNSFEKLNEHLRQQKLELMEYCSLMEARLRESGERFSYCCPMSSNSGKCAGEQNPESAAGARSYLFHASFCAMLVSVGLAMLVKK